MLRKSYKTILIMYLQLKCFSKENCSRRYKIMPLLFKLVVAVVNCQKVLNVLLCKACGLLDWINSCDLV